MAVVTDPADADRLDHLIEGEGPAALVLHGAYSTRDEVMPVFRPVLEERGMRGIYPDLPGMGESEAFAADTTDAALDALDALIAEHIGAERFVVIGHSFGAFLARGVAARHPEQVRGLALLSPYEDDFEPAPARVVEDDGDTDEVDAEVRGDYEGYFVVRTAGTRERFERAVRPALGRYDGERVERVMTASTRTPDPDAVPFEHPVVILLGRDDAFIGWRAQQRLGDAYPRATLVLADGAGHALMHERPALVAAAVHDWLDRVALASAS